MKKRMIWLGTLLITLLFSVSALALTNPPPAAGDLPVPAHTVPVITNVLINGNDVTMDVSGTFNDGGAIIYYTTPSGEDQQYIMFNLNGGSLSGTVSGLPADATSWRLYMICVYDTANPDVVMYYDYDPAGALESYTIRDTPASVSYSFDNEGRMSNYYTDDMTVFYNEDGSLNGYTVETASGEQEYNGKNELVSERSSDDNGNMTTLNYDGGVLVSRTVYMTGGNRYMYDSQGILRKSVTSDADGNIIYNLYDSNGNLNSYSRRTVNQYEEFDAKGNLIGKSYYDEDSNTNEVYENGQLVHKSVSGELPDGRSYTDDYENGVFTERTIDEEDGAYHYDAKGNYTGKTVYYGDEYEEYNAEGALTEYMVYSEQQGGVWLVYNHRNALQALEYYDLNFSDMYRYDAKEKVWYLNDVPYDGPVPVILKELKLAQEIIWYPNNTVCSFGPQFRDAKPGLTDLWYMFTPVDLSHDGTQTFELIGGNMYVLGQAAVTVSGDSVTVNYSTVKGKYGHIYVKSEYLNFFPDLDSVKTVVPEEMGEGFSFGQTLSIQKDLGGDTNVLMFIRNVATYRNLVDDSTLLRRFYKNLPSRVQLRDEMLALMD